MSALFKRLILIYRCGVVQFWTFDAQCQFFLFPFLCGFSGRFVYYLYKLLKVDQYFIASMRSPMLRPVETQPVKSKLDGWAAFSLDRENNGMISALVGSALRKPDGAGTPGSSLSFNRCRCHNIMLFASGYRVSLCLAELDNWHIVLRVSVQSLRQKCVEMYTPFKADVICCAGKSVYVTSHRCEQ